jgi:hypothetical protein
VAYWKGFCKSRKLPETLKNNSEYCILFENHQRVYRDYILFIYESYIQFLFRNRGKYLVEVQTANYLIQNKLNLIIKRGCRANPRCFFRSQQSILHAHTDCANSCNQSKTASHWRFILSAKKTIVYIVFWVTYANSGWWCLFVYASAPKKHMDSLTWSRHRRVQIEGTIFVSPFFTWESCHRRCR